MCLNEDMGYAYEESDDEYDVSDPEYENDFDINDYYPDGDAPSRDEMLEEMDNDAWEHDLESDATDEEVAKEYLHFCEERYADVEDMLFPNGRDYDAEDEDGPFG